MTADLHIHTNYSDGFLTPEQIVAVARQIGLTTISITDHDSVGGVEQAIRAGQASQIEVIPGVELNTKLGDREIHILGYFIDQRSAPLSEALAEARKTRVQRARMIVEKLNELDIAIEYDDVERLVGHSAIGRPHIARILCERGYTDSVQGAFERYLKIGAPAYVGLIKWNPYEAIEVVRNAGGIPVLAHPGCYKADDLIPELQAKGLQGLEVYCLKHSPSQTEHYFKIAQEKGLLVTGGSDFHNAIDAIYDAVLGAVPLADEYVAKLKAAANNAVKTLHRNVSPVTNGNHT